MAVLLWPSELPQSPQKGYTESIGVSILRSPVDSGPAKQRYRGSRPDQLDVSFILTTVQVARLRQFITNTSTAASPGIGGVGRFKFLHPRTNTLVEVRIVPSGDGELFKLQYLAPGFYQTSMKFEVLP